MTLGVPGAGILETRAAGEGGRRGSGGAAQIWDLMNGAIDTAAEHKGGGCGRSFCGCSAVTAHAGMQRQ